MMVQALQEVTQQQDASGAGGGGSATDGGQNASAVQQSDQQANAAAVFAAAMAAAAGLMPGGLQQQLLGFGAADNGAAIADEEDEDGEGGEDAHADLAPHLLAALQESLGFTEGAAAAEAILPRHRKRVLASLYQQQAAQDPGGTLARFLAEMGGSGGGLLGAGGGGDGMMGAGGLPLPGLDVSGMGGMGGPSSGPQRAPRQSQPRRFYEPTQKVRPQLLVCPQECPA